MSIQYKTVEELHELLIQKELTVTELIEETLAYLEKVDEEIGSFISYDKEGALRTAKEIDERGVRSGKLLDGIPIAVKDNIVTKEGNTTAASKMLENFESVYDATVIEKIKDAGMVIIGKVNLDEFAMGGTTETSSLQHTVNPWNYDHVPGGSSGGSAAAVASGIVPVSLGTDTGGSIRQPAAYTNLVGMKPTYGTVSRFGLIAFASSLDQIGPMTRTVKDNALLLNAIGGKDEKDGTSADLDIDYTQKIGQEIKGLKVGIPKEYFDEEIVEEDVLDFVRKAIEELKSLGAEIVEVELPHLKYGVSAYYAIASAEASSNLQRFDGIRYGYRPENVDSLEDLYVRTRSEGFGKEVKKRIVLGNLVLGIDYYDKLYEKSAKVRTIIREEFEDAFKKVDVLVGPTTTSTAPSFAKKEKTVQSYMEDALTVPINLAGVPSLTVPVGLSNNLPVGMQIIGNYYTEDVLYQIGHAYEEKTGHDKAYPKFVGGEK